jgi:RNA polymerase sigma-70 factor (ECF subfamily)
LATPWTPDSAAFDALYREHAPRLCAFLHQATQSSQAAEDLTQDIFTRLWSHPSAYDPTLSSFRTYLFGIARHRASEWWRQRRSHEPMPEDHNHPQSGSNPEHNTLAADVLARLPEDQRLLLWLREIEGRSYSELAIILNIPIGTVRSRLFAARQAFQHIWLDHPAKSCTTGAIA